jgi:hypothetical protein
VGQALVVIGLLIAAIGGAIWAGLPIGRLPGDIIVRREGFTFYLPITSALIVSAVLSIVARVVKW